MKSSVDQPAGRYSIGGDVDRSPNRLGWWERTILAKQNDDILVNVSAKLVGRPDLISDLVYGDRRYGWLVLQYNTILDIDVDLAEGSVISLPAHDRVL
jgi:hypothetical protein